MAPLPPRPARESDDGKPAVPAGIPGNCLLSSALRHLPRLPSSPRPLPAKLPDRVDSPTLDRRLRDLQDFLASVAERCARALEDAASWNGFLSPIFSMPANFQRFCQTHCRRSITPNSLSAHHFAAILPGDSVAGLVVANGINNFLNIYNTLLIVRILFTWFPNAPPSIVSPLSTICDPYLNIFRGIIPPLGGALDLSPVLAFLVLNALQSTAAALPAELPAPGTPQQRSASPVSYPSPFNLTTMQEKWIRRLHGKRAKNPEDTKRTSE